MTDMAKSIPLPPTGSKEFKIANVIWEHIQPGNPHGPQSDLFFHMPYVRDYAEQATRIAQDLIDKGWDLPEPEAPITAEDLERRATPEVVFVGTGILALVAEDNTTIDMSPLQAVRLRLISEIPGHTSHLDLNVGEELWLSCSCGKFSEIVSSGAVESFWDVWAGHLTEVLTRPKLDDLADGTYFDGTYEWRKDGKDWTPLMAPQGMPKYPDIERLKRVKKTYEDLS